MHNNISLAQYIAQNREKQGLTQQELSQKANIKLEDIQSIELGLDLFLAPTIRQKLARALKLENKEIKKYEKKSDMDNNKALIMDNIREAILLNYNKPDFVINCPNCGEKLITRVAKLYDLEGALVLRPKARCPKCPFQLID